MTPPRQRVPWSHGDRLLMIVLGITLVVALGLVLQFRTQDVLPSVIVPTPILPSPNAYDFYVRAGSAVVGGNIISPPTPQPVNPTAAQAAVVRQNAPAIGFLHQGFQYPFHAPPVRSFFTPLTQYAKMRGLARLLGLQARVDAAQGDWAGAMTADLDCVQMGEDMARGSGLIGMLVGGACENIGRRHAWQHVDHLTAAQARAAARRLEGIHARHVPYADTLQEDEWTGQSGLLEVMRRPDWPAGIGDQTPSSSISDTLAHWKTGVAIHMTGKRTIMANYTRYMDQTIANTRQPYAAHLPAATPPSDPVNQAMFFDLTDTRINEVRADTENVLLLTMLALRAYQQEHGAYPTALSALAPGYLRAVPKDPFALSGPLQYQPKGQTYLLYSVGPDGKNDGGKPIFDAAKPAPTVPGGSDQRYYVLPESQGDIVAGVNIY